MITPRNNSGSVKLLVTSFGAFPGMPNNPSRRLVASFAQLQRRRLSRLGIDLVTAELPVVFATVAAVLRDLEATHACDAIIHVGVAGRRAKLSVETRALNRIGALRTDAFRRLSAARTVALGQPAQLRARWPSARIVAAMKRTGAATQTSVDAGDYVCNQTLYLTLLRTTVPAGFLHIPKPRVGQRRKCSKSSRRTSLDQMVHALTQIAILMGVEVRRRT